MSERKRADECCAIGNRGEIILSEAQRLRWGLTPGTEVYAAETAHGIFLRPADPPLAKVHVEPTSSCNLACRTCVRNSWTEPTGFMRMETYRHLLDGLGGLTSLRQINFWGIGEPLLHPNIAEMIAQAKSLDVRTEVVTNGLLLTPKTAEALVNAGLDSIVVSVDGVSPAAYADARSGASLSTVLANLEQLQRIRVSSSGQNPEVALAFVAMRRNVHELPELGRLAMAVGASRVLVTNLMPYAEELKDEILYGRIAGGSYRTFRSEWNPEVSLPRMDPIAEVEKAQSLLLSHLDAAALPEGRLAGAGGYCPFVGEASASVGWDGRVSPCVPLLHSHTCFVIGRAKSMRAYTAGDVNRESIRNLWHNDEYRQFRDRVMRFDFAPCTDCGGCDLAEANERDCAGNTFPVCGDCLWAKGVIRCP